jgi:hypothetical protein
VIITEYSGGSASAERTPALAPEIANVDIAAGHCSPIEFRVGFSIDPQPAIYPGYGAPVIRRAANGERELVPMSWEFLLQEG